MFNLGLLEQEAERNMYTSNLYLEMLQYNIWKVIFWCRLCRYLHHFCEETFGSMAAVNEAEGRLIINLQNWVISNIYKWAGEHQISVPSSL